MSDSNSSVDDKTRVAIRFLFWMILKKSYVLLQDAFSNASNVVV